MKSTKSTTLPKTIDLFNALWSQQQWLTLLRDKGKPYGPLIDQLLNIDIEEDNRPGGALIKDIAKSIGISTGKVNKWANMIYEDLWKLNSENPEVFKFDKSNRYNIYFTGDASFKNNSLTFFFDITFNVGDAFACKFVLPKMENEYFFVERISHYFTKGILETMVVLRPGQYNLYEHLLREKLSFLEIISYDEAQMYDRYKLNEILKERRWKGEFIKLKS